MRAESEREWISAEMPLLSISPSSHTSLIPLCCFLALLSQVTEKLLEVENETMMKVADLEKLLLQKDKDLQTIRVRCRPR